MCPSESASSRCTAVCGRPGVESAHAARTPAAEARPRRASPRFTRASRDRCACSRPAPQRIPRASEHRASSARLDAAAAAAGRLQPLRPARRFPGPRRRRPLLRAAAGYRAQRGRRCEPAVARLVRRRQPAGHRTQAGAGRAAVEGGGPGGWVLCVRVPRAHTCVCARVLTVTVGPHRVSGG